MKKLLVLLCVVFMCACTSEEEKDDNNYDTSSKINPPAWIQGKWKNEAGTVIEFTKSDLKSVDDEGYKFSVLYEFNYWEMKGHDIELIESSTDDSYIFEYRDAASTKKYFNFVKISDNKIESKRFYKGIYTKM